MATDLQGISLPTVWVGADDAEPHFVNQLVIQVAPDEVYLSFGLAKPPIVTSQGEEARAELAAIGVAYVHPVYRFIVSPAKFLEMAEAIAQVRVHLEPPVEEAT